MGSLKKFNRLQALRGIDRECCRAQNNFDPFNSAHEGLAVIWEEFEELKQEVFKTKETRGRQEMINEATQVGAMALRFLVDCCGVEE